MSLNGWRPAISIAVVISVWHTSMGTVVNTGVLRPRRFEHLRGGWSDGDSCSDSTMMSVACEDGLAPKLLESTWNEKESDSLNWVELARKRAR